MLIVLQNNQLVEKQLAPQNFVVSRPVDNRCKDEEPERTGDSPGYQLGRKEYDDPDKPAWSRMQAFLGVDH